MITLIAKKREIFGKKTKNLRKQGLIPAELYGRGIANIHLSVPAKDFLQAYGEAGEHSVLYLEVDGQSHPVLVHGVEHSPIKQKILTVDFYEVKMDEKVKTHVPLEFEGEPPAVKEKEGILIKSMDEIEVEAFPADLPPSVLVDLSQLTELDQSIYVKDLPKSDKYSYVVDPETVVASVTPPREEEVEEVAPPTEEAVVAEKAVPEEEAAQEPSEEAKREAPEREQAPSGAGETPKKNKLSTGQERGDETKT